MRHCRPPGSLAPPLPSERSSHPTVVWPGPLEAEMTVMPWRGGPREGTKGCVSADLPVEARHPRCPPPIPFQKRINGLLRQRRAPVP